MKKKQWNISENQWVYPASKNFKFGCCDCGLIHDMDFEVVLLVPIGQKDGDELLKVVTLVDPDIVVRMRARRNDKATVKRRKEIGSKNKEK